MADPRLQWRGINAPDFQGASRILNTSALQWDRAFGRLQDTIGDVRTRQQTTRSNEALPLLAKVAEEAGVNPAIDAVSGMVSARDRTAALNEAIMGLRGRALDYEQSRAARRNTDARTASTSASTSRANAAQARKFALEDQLGRFTMEYLNGPRTGEGSGSAGLNEEPLTRDLSETSVEDRASGTLEPTVEPTANDVGLRTAPRQAPVASTDTDTGTTRFDGYARDDVGAMLAAAVGEGQNYISPDQMFGYLDRYRVDRGEERTEQDRQTSMAGAAWADRVRGDLDANDPIADAYARIDQMDISPAAKQAYREQTAAVLGQSQAPLDQRALELAFQYGDIPMGEIAQRVMTDPSIPTAQKRPLIAAIQAQREGLPEGTLSPMDVPAMSEADRLLRNIVGQTESSNASSPERRAAGILNAGAGDAAQAGDTTVEGGTVDGSDGASGGESGGSGGSASRTGRETMMELYQNYENSVGQSEWFAEDQAIQSYGSFERLIRDVAESTGLDENRVARIALQEAVRDRNWFTGLFTSDARVDREALETILEPYTRLEDGSPNPRQFQIRDEMITAEQRVQEAQAARAELEEIARRRAWNDTPQLQARQEALIGYLQELADAAAVSNGGMTAEERDAAQAAAEAVAAEAALREERDRSSVRAQEEERNRWMESPRERALRRLE